MSGRVLIVDDHLLMRRTLRSLLLGYSIRVCGDAANGREAIERVRALQPDLVLLDVNLPVMNGVEAAVEIHKIAPSTKILFLTIIDNPNGPATAKAFGFHGWIPKSAAETMLVPTIQNLLQTEGRSASVASAGLGSVRKPKSP
jgi:DNA-binding NarL/FixJ family response regulator